ncbi:SDR family oxidoreductase [Cyanobium sp. T1B-Tous]|uniref:SDR family NAD(P)-dependent oxidoreductase n=1 Tax=Cyanobium sp. T1B-Tous TaxID=2823721 RepID=UPI0020CB7948|nr:SDR family oxidoreductase [Cyanobium sp. T1B-Tous]MCP9807331.1 SDR family oxidoreductase [Cyanobium sp. T1B-Tous]
MKSIVITGPSGHLGAAIVSHLLNSFNVIGISRTASGLQLDHQVSRKCFGKYIPIDQDLSAISTEALVALINESVLDANSSLVGLVNNAFTVYPGTALSIDTESVHSCAESLLGIHVRLSLAVAEALKTGRGGSIVNIASIYGKVSPRPDLYSCLDSMNPILYGTFKAGLIQASRYLSSLLAPDGIRVNSVSYGPFPSLAVQENDPEFIERLGKQTHLKRIGIPSEAAGVVSFLLSEESSYITGADIPVDGGWTAW